MDTQEAFNQMVTHLRKQGGQSLYEDSCGLKHCRYRMDDAQVEGGVLKCAVGCLIPDEMYQASFEGYPVMSLILELSPDLNALLRGVNKGVLQFMQQVHDFHNVSSWEGYFQQIAYLYNLSLPEILK